MHAYTDRLTDIHSQTERQTDRLTDRHQINTWVSQSRPVRHVEVAVDVLAMS